MVFGVPGSGKSYNEKSEMGQVLCFSKDDIIVVDPMGEYKGIAAAWGGQYINLTQSAENVFYVNPFHVPEWMEGCMWQMSCGMGKLIFIFKVTFLY